MCQADEPITGDASAPSAFQSEDSAEAESGKCFITLVFEWTDAVSKVDYWNDSALGPALGAATGNLLHVNDILEQALAEIAHGCSDAEDIAQDALDKANAHVRSQMNLHPRRRQTEEPCKGDERTAPSAERQPDNKGATMTIKKKLGQIDYEVFHSEYPNDKIIEIITDKITDYYVAGYGHIPTGDVIAKDIIQTLSSSGYIICQASDAETGTGSAPQAAFQFIAFAEAAMVPALLAAAKHGLPPDVQELLVHGDAARGIPSGILIHMLRAAANSPRQLEEAQADTATED
jgi:hypothetical protein